jgi:hypothetical protein
MPWRFRPRVGPFVWRPSRRRPSVLGAVLSVVIVSAVIVVLIVALWP